MELIVKRQPLAASLALVMGAIRARSPKPVLACVKIVAEDGVLTLAGTDLEIAAVTRLNQVDIKRAGSALIPAEKLSQIVTTLDDETLTISVEKDTAEIRGQQSRYTVFGYPVADFAPVPTFTGDGHFGITAGELHRIVSQTVFATAKENSRYAINGVLLSLAGNKLTVVATDGRRLAIATGDCKAVAGSSGPPNIIVPPRGVMQALRVFQTPEQVVRVRFDDNQILFATDDAVVSSNLVEGSFPPYKDVIPRDSDKKAVIPVAALASAVRRAALLTNEESKGVRLAFGPQGLTISSRAPEMGEAEVRTTLTQYTGDAIEIGFNPAFILDALKVIGAEEQITLDMLAASKPSLLRAGTTFSYVLMPVNLQ